MSNNETLIKEIKDLQEKIDKLQQISRYEPIDYDLLEQYEDRQRKLILRVEENNNCYKEEEFKDNSEVWNVPMNTSFINCNKKNINYIDYKALALFTYFSCRKSEEVCDLLDLDISEVEEHRYLYQNFINENIEKFETLSKWKKRNIYTQINKLVKSGNKVVSADFTDDGRLYYKIIPYIDKGNKLNKSGTFVTIESDILKYLIHFTNSNVIKTYCVFKWLLWDDKKQSYTEKRVDRIWLANQIGLSINASKNIDSIGTILKGLIDINLLERRKETITEFGVNKVVYYYKIVPHDTWKEHYKNL